MSRTLLGIACAALWVAPALAQDAREERRQVQPPEGAAAAGSGERRYEPATPPPPDEIGGTVSGRLAPADTAPAGAGEGGALGSARWLGDDDGAVRLLLPDGERRLRPGDQVGRDTLRSVRARQLVLARDATQDDPAGVATVVVDFVQTGAPSVRVIWKRNPKPTLLAGVP